MSSRCLAVAALLVAAILAGCGDSGRGRDETRRGGASESRAGRIYDERIPSPLGGGETIAVTVHEPRALVRGESYPLVLEGHGFAGSRQTGRPFDTGTAFGAGVDFAGISPSPERLRGAGYGVVSIDQRGHGESGGTIRLMDPDFEGANLIAVLDWAEANLEWLAYRREGGAENPVVGSMGLSYGGGYQLVLHAIDPKRRLDAIVPHITWNDLTYAIAPNGVIKAGWAIPLFLAGNFAGGGGNFDPFVVDTFTTGFFTNRLDRFALDFFGYHGLGYFCRGEAVATNGGPGTAPGYPPERPPRVNALFFQSFRDTILNFNHAHANYECLREAGGDVRLLTYPFGHSAIPVPDLGAALFEPITSFLDGACGDVSAAEATIAFFDEHLKGMRGAADAVIPAGVCLSLAVGDSVVVDRVTRGKAGREADVPATLVVAGIPEVPSIADLGIVAGSAGDVVGGIPFVEVDVHDATGLSSTNDDVVLFVGVGRARAALPVLWELLDNQVTPIRGLGDHAIDLAGIAERLAPGDRLALLVYGGDDQYTPTGSLNLLRPVILPVRVSGKAWMPMLGSGG